MATTSKDIQDAEIVPTTTGQYVRGKFGYWAKRYVGMITLGIPVLAATRASTFGSASEWILPAIGAWALCSATALLVILLTLAAGGWWHTRRYRNR